MKKIIVRVLIAGVVVVVLVLVGVGLFLDNIVKRGIETVGPMVAKVEVKLDAVSLSLLSGSGKLKGLVVGNPPGYKTPSAIQVGKASLALQPGSIFADKVIIKSISLEAPEVTFETDLKGNNLSTLLANLQSGTSSTQTNAPKSGASRKLQVDDFLIRDAKLHVSVTTLGGRSATVALPEIHLTALGTGPEGITAAELAQRVLAVIEKEAVQASSGAVAGLAKDAAGLSKDLGKSATGTVEKLGQGLGGFLKKK